MNFFCLISVGFLCFFLGFEEGGGGFIPKKFPKIFRVFFFWGVFCCLVATRMIESGPKVQAREILRIFGDLTAQRLGS